MGTIFRYIDDSILPHYVEKEKHCQVCEQEKPQYQIYIDIEFEDSVEQYFSACAECIRKIPLRYFSPKDDEGIIQQLVNQHHPKGTKSASQRFAMMVNICDEYRRTPRLPNFIQHDDWPHCCGDFAEFIGDAGETFFGPYHEFEWWGPENDGALEYGLEGMIGGEDRVSLFRCLACEKKYWTFQCT
ncbi:Hypothetical protein PBC10988_25850 [Planctomycetales bacterium 10988]|nr:Hypothetical protein PBC10988_25850 [Planctomycetales bacterium 10988]